jgi:hypothetical protein
VVTSRRDDTGSRSLAGTIRPVAGVSTREPRGLEPLTSALNVERTGNRAVSAESEALGNDSETPPSLRIGA